MKGEIAVVAALAWASPVADAPVTPKGVLRLPVPPEGKSMCFEKAGVCIVREADFDRTNALLTRAAAVIKAQRDQIIRNVGGGEFRALLVTRSEMVAPEIRSLLAPSSN